MALDLSAIRVAVRDFYALGESLSAATRKICTLPVLVRGALSGGKAQARAR